MSSPSRRSMVIPIRTRWPVSRPTPDRSVTDCRSRWGTALAAKMDGSAWRTFVLTGDGELQEGSNWEAAMSAAQFRLDNLTLIIDRNQLQQDVGTERTVGLQPLARPLAIPSAGASPRLMVMTWSSCGTCSTHMPLAPGRPTCVIAHTHKGRGRVVHGRQGRVASSRADGCR